MNGIASSGAKGINALGPRYMGKYHPLMEIGPRYLLIQGTHRELTEGNGPPFVLDVAPMLVLFAIVMTFCILGCFLPSMPLLLICVPIFVPIAKVFGWDLIWFGVIITVLDNMASITPPFGISLFVMKEVAGVTLGAMYRSAVPFVIALFVCLLLIVLFPSLATYLPTLMNGSRTADQPETAESPVPYGAFVFARRKPPRSPAGSQRPAQAGHGLSPRLQWVLN